MLCARWLQQMVFIIFVVPVIRSSAAGIQTLQPGGSSPFEIVVALGPFMHLLVMPLFWHRKHLRMKGKVNLDHECLLHYLHRCLRLTLIHRLCLDVGSLKSNLQCRLSLTPTPRRSSSLGG